MNILFDDSMNDELVEKQEKPVEKEGGSNLMTIALIVLIGVLLAYIAYQHYKKED